jgi:translin
VQPSGFEALASDARLELDAAFGARERGLSASRKAIRASANAIRALHRNEADRAARLIEEAGTLLEEAATAMDGFPAIRHAGFYADAAKEYAEARLTEAIFAGRPVPTPEDLGVELVSYLHGLGETVGEMRRRLLDTLRAGDLEGGEHLLTVMDAIYDLLAGLDYPDGMTAGLRRTTDAARAIIERSRSDLTTTAVQERLRSELGRSAGGTPSLK